MKVNEGKKEFFLKLVISIRRRREEAVQPREEGLVPFQYDLAVEERLADVGLACEDPGPDARLAAHPEVRLRGRGFFQADLAAIQGHAEMLLCVGKIELQHRLDAGGGAGSKLRTISRMRMPASSLTRAWTIAGSMPCAPI